MEISSRASCARCQATLHSAFVGRVCPRCLLASVVSDTLADNSFDLTDVPDGVEPPTAEGLRIGARVGDYELLDVLGRGGMAVVYLARQISLDRLVAFKTIAATLSADARSQERFRREARAVAQLDHHGIVSVHDTGMLCDALFYTMDYVDGQDLNRALRQRLLPPRESASLMRRIADAVGYAHSRGIVHRDLKPANILLDGAGEPHVADFGLAFEIAGGGGLTLTGDLLGTPPYMAPEVLAGGAGRATPQTDVYSLGAMLFQMLTGRTPFIGGSPSEILHLALHEQPPSLRLLSPGVPRDLEIICLKCLEKTAAGRYEDAAEMGHDLQRFLNGEHILAKPVSAPVRLLRWSKRRPALTAFIVALILGTIGATWAAFIINSGRQRALRAETSAQEALWRANLAHAQAARRTTQADARGQALTAVADAARFRPTLELRNEAISTMCLDEAEVQRSWPLEIGATAAVLFDPALATYLVETSPGKLVRRSCVNDHEMGQFEIPKIKLVGVPVFSPDGRYLAARYADNVVRLWDVEAGRVVFELPGWPSPMMGDTTKYGYDLTFRPDGAQLAVGTAGVGLTLYGVPGGQEQGRWAAEVQPSIVRYSPDGTQIAVAARQVAQVQLLDAAKLTVQHTIALPGVPICAAWNPAGDRLAVGTRASRIHLIAAGSGQMVDTISAYENGGVAQVVFHPQRPLLAGFGSEAVRFWDPSTGRLLMEVEGVNNQPILAFDPSGSRFCGYNNYSHRAMLAAVRPSSIYRSVAPSQPVRSAIATGAMDASRDGRWLACSSSGAVRLYDARSGRLLHTIPGTNSQDMMTAVFAPDGQSLLVSSTRTGLSRIEITAAADGQPVLGPPRVLDPEPEFSIEGMADDGRVLLISEQQEVAKVVTPANPSATAVRWPVAKVTSASFSADGKKVLTEAGEPIPGEAAVKVWDLSRSEPGLVASFGDDPGGRVQCARRSDWVLVTGDKTTSLWHFGTWQPGPKLPVALQGETHHARLSPDGSLVVIEANGKLHFLATATGERLATCEPPVKPSGICVNEVFSEDGASLSSLWQYGSVHLWDLSAMHRELNKIGLDWSGSK